MFLPVLTEQQALAHRLHAHHLDAPLPAGGLAQAAGACGLQNSPPGAWETAAFVRVRETGIAGLHDALYHDKTLLQAWSVRGVPLVFPTADAGVFLAALQARPGEEPWIYTRGIGLAEEFLGMTAGELLPLVRQAAAALERDTVQTKEALDQYLADRVRPLLPAQKRPLWDAPSMYGSPGRQTVGGAVASFLLRPCAFGGQVVFGFRQGVHPTFTAPARWLGQPLPQADPDAAGRELVRRFLHCYGPATRQELIDWLGCSPAQASRLWDAAAPGTAEVTLAGRTRRMLAADLDALPGLPRPQQAPLLLLGPHDPYLDQRDRTLLLPDKRLQRLVWRTVGNPGAILLQGRVAGCWKSKTRRGSLLVEAVFWQEPGPAARAAVQAKAEAWAAFRQMPLAECQFSVLA